MHSAEIAIGRLPRQYSRHRRLERCNLLREASCLPLSWDNPAFLRAQSSEVDVESIGANLRR
jgi:hypothetical protein